MLESLWPDVRPAAAAAPGRPAKAGGCHQEDQRRPGCRGPQGAQQGDDSFTRTALSLFQKYVSQNEQEDYLLMGFSSQKSNPFREKSSCNLL